MGIASRAKRIVVWATIDEKERMVVPLRGLLPFQRNDEDKIIVGEDGSEIVIPLSVDNIKPDWVHEKILRKDEKEYVKGSRTIHIDCGDLSLFTKEQLKYLLERVKIE